MRADYRLHRRARACMACEADFEPGATIVSTIHEAGEAFERKDLCEGCVGEAPPAFSIWRTLVPPPPPPRRTVDFDLALEFLRRLAAEAAPAREGITYVLTLLLGRKRRVKVRETRRLPEGELLTVVVPGPEEDEVIQVRAPRLGAGDVERLQGELAQLLGIEMPASDTGVEPESGKAGELDASRDSAPA